MRMIRCVAWLFLVAGLVYPAHGKPGKAYTDPASADADFALQGEYTGTVQGKEGPIKLGVQVIALGDGEFRAVGYAGGLPGDGWSGDEKEEVTATMKDGEVFFEGKKANGNLADGKLSIRSKEGTQMGDLKRVIRTSPTLGAKPPTGAVVLFDGSSVDGWTKAKGKGPAKMTKDGLLIQGANSKRKFGSHKLHVEFRLPYQPQARGQGRGNSGIYLQGRYEVQMLDSFGLQGRDNECGGLYSVAPPRVNMCYPPLCWQTYDIEFTEAEYEGNKKVKNARITVRHNGVLIHEDRELPRRTPAGPTAEGPEAGVVHLQDHGNPVRYRNIWVVETVAEN